MIKIRDVCKSFGSHEALKHINLDVVEGETLAIIGGSGSGKSTLLRLLIGLDRPTSGEIYIMGSPIANMSEKQLDELRMHMGMVFQYSALFDSMTVGENVAFGLREHTDYSDEKIRSIVAEKLEQAMAELEQRAAALALTDLGERIAALEGRIQGLTQAEYEALTPDTGTLYLILPEEGDEA